jgi:hypothetical protein
MRYSVIVRPIFVLPLLLALGACSSAPSPASYVSRVDSAPETTPVTGADASLMMVQMPAPGGLVTSVREKTFANGVRQQAVLEGGGGLGENQLEISVQTPNAISGGETLSIGRPSQDGIRREIIARYPKLEMRIVTQPRQNALGVFGLAIGRSSGGVRCVFAWQWVDDLRGGAGSGGVSLMGAKFGGGSGEATPASIRVHLCRKDATVDDLAATVEGLTLAAPAVVDRALDPGRRVAATVAVPSSRGASRVASAPIPDGSLESALGPQKNVAVAEAPRARRSTTRVVRRRAPAEPNAVAIERTAPVAEQPVYANGPRYLAPVAGAPVAAAAPVVYASPQPMAAMTPTRQLDPSLPAAAYRGPSGRN